ncbi:MAG: TetR/AcrR family transcriptional regulator [Acidimicrobiales bacterium]
MTTSSTTDTGTTDTGRVDGRRLRRQQGRIAVVDALIDLVLEGHAPPTADEIAARAGVSTASVFRYFDSLDDLRREGIQRYLKRYDHLIDVADIGEHDLTRRVATLVDARQRYYETIDPMARLARAQAFTVPELDEALGRVRATLTDQLSEHFAAELVGLRAAPRRELVALVAALTSHESWEQLHRQGLDRAAVGRALRAGVERLLAPTAVKR